MRLRNIFGIYNENKHKVFSFLNIKIKFKRKLKQTEILMQHILELEDRLLSIEMEIVRNSGLWDPKYYIENYHPEMRKHEALVYYMKEGFKHKEKPSKILDVENYAVPSQNINPILDLISRGRYQYTRIFFENKYPVTQEYIDNYNNKKNNRGKARKVVYTCITNNYDNLQELNAFAYTDDSWDYVAYTDNKEHIAKKNIGIWEIRPLAYTELDNARNNRWHKIHPHLLFPEYEKSIYIDADINILTSKFWDMVNSTSKKILLPVHADRVDLYKEILWANEMGFDSKDISDAQYKMIKQTGFPENYGMPENNIVYRLHNDPKMINMMEEWWFFVKNYSQRDQTSLAYILWKNNISIKDCTFENTRIDYKNFCIYKHKKEYAL